MFLAPQPKSTRQEGGQYQSFKAMQDWVQGLGLPSAGRVKRGACRV